MAQETGNKSGMSVAEQMAAKRKADADAKANRDQQNKENSERDANQERDRQERQERSEAQSNMGMSPSRGQDAGMAGAQGSVIQDNAAVSAGQGGNADMINEAQAKSAEEQGKDPRYPIVAQSARAMIIPEDETLDTQAPRTKERDQMEADAAAKIHSETESTEEGNAFYLYSVKANLGGSLPNGTPIRFKGHYLKTSSEEVKDYLLDGYKRFVTEVSEQHYKLAEDVLVPRAEQFVDDPLHPVVDDRQYTKKSPSHP